MLPKTAFDLWREEESRNSRIMTLCKKLDNSIHFQSGVITELCGASGSGKTQMCLLLSICVQFPLEIGGMDGKAVYIDTNQDFNPHRLSELCAQSYDHHLRMHQRLHGNNPKVPLFPQDRLQQNISYVYCGSYVELLAAIEQLKSDISELADIKLIVIDSFSFPFRNFENNTERTAILFQLMTDLQILAHRHKIVVILTNELTTRISPAGESVICPALGDSHSHKVGQRVILSSIGDYHSFYLQKCINSGKQMIVTKFPIGGDRRDPGGGGVYF